MRYCYSLLLSGLFLVLVGGCSEKKKVETPAATAPPPPVQKGKAPPAKAEK
jgi:hypothetical protein